MLTETNPEIVIERGNIMGSETISDVSGSGMGGFGGGMGGLLGGLLVGALAGNGGGLFGGNRGEGLLLSSKINGRSNCAKNEGNSESGAS